MDGGFNYVRIPLNYWDVTPDAAEPYPANLGWSYVNQAISWCAKYGLQVGLGHFFDWLNNFDSYSKRSTAALVETVNRLKGPSYSHVKLLELVNEPYMIPMNGATIEKYPSGGPELMISEGFLGTNIFGGSSLLDQGLGTARMDYHYYSIFDANGIALDTAGHLQHLQDYLIPTLEGMKAIAPTFLGEFSAAMTDCAPHLNSVNGGSRFDGTFPGYSNVCGGCKCADAININTWSASKKNSLRAYVNAQIIAAKAGGVGYVFWTWKTENKLVEWDWQYLLSQGMVSVPPGS
ncbi:exo-1,3-beta-glucanase [Gonapodya sp. JEL0774]|nr:exo-1,3-beta-glucanase [Gonapodya sp. JEL0774]